MVSHAGVIARTRRNLAYHSLPNAGILVSLTAEHPRESYSYPRRLILLPEIGHVVKVGRASKVEAKGFIAAENNGWFDSPVMSRDHAKMSMDDKVGLNRPTLAPPAFADCP